jgi:uncharacterized phage protein (TIGR02220 family)
MKNGYIKIHRSLMEKGYYKNSKYVHLWVHLLMKANHKSKEIVFGGKLFPIKRGQFITSRDKLSEETGIPPGTVGHILGFFKSEQQIEQQGFSKFSLITIRNYDKHQKSEQQIEQHVSSKRTAREQHVNTTNNDKNDKNDKNILSLSQKIIEYFNQKTGQKRSLKCQETRKLITGRIAEGRTFEDFQKVIDKKFRSWKDDPKMAIYLRPSTLFRPANFEDYLNEPEIKTEKEKLEEHQKKVEEWAKKKMEQGEE